MAVTAIIHTTTRVVRRLTTDDAPPVGADETAVVLAAGFDFSGFAGNRVKLDGSNNPVQASIAEWRNAGLDEDDNRTQAVNRKALMGTRLDSIVTQADAVLADGTASTSAKNLATALKNFSNGFKAFLG